MAKEPPAAVAAARRLLRNLEDPKVRAALGGPIKNEAKLLEFLRRVIKDSSDGADAVQGR